MDVQIEFEGTQYRVDENAKVLNLIVLPSGKVIKANRWKEDPTRPVGLHQVETLFHDLSPKSKAIVLGGVLAYQI